MRTLIIAAAVLLAGCSSPPTEREAPLPTVERSATTKPEATLPKVKRPATTRSGTCDEIGEYLAEPGDPRDRDGDGIACEGS